MTKHFAALFPKCATAPLQVKDGTVLHLFLRPDDAVSASGGVPVATAVTGGQRGTGAVATASVSAVSASAVGQPHGPAAATAPFPVGAFLRRMQLQQLAESQRTVRFLSSVLILVSGLNLITLSVYAPPQICVQLPNCSN